jgi:hypothetical protein
MTREELKLLAWMLANGLAELVERHGKLYPVTKI